MLGTSRYSKYQLKLVYNWIVASFTLCFSIVWRIVRRQTRSSICVVPNVLRDRVRCFLWLLIFSVRHDQSVYLSRNVRRVPAHVHGHRNESAASEPAYQRYSGVLDRSYKRTYLYFLHDVWSPSLLCVYDKSLQMYQSNIYEKQTLSEDTFMIEVVVCFCFVIMSVGQDVYRNVYNLFKSVNTTSECIHVTHFQYCLRFVPCYYNHSVVERSSTVFILHIHYWYL